MGCDIDYYLDYDFSELSAQEFLAEFKRRVAPLPVVLTGMEAEYPPDSSPEDFHEGGSPYAHNQVLPDCWEIDCFLYDFETQYNSKIDSITLRLHSNGRSCGWELSFYKKALCFYPFDENFSFLHGSQRWRIFEEDYLKGQSADIERNIGVTLSEIAKNIVPIFHCKKMLAIGDQGLHQDISVELENGKTMEGAFECVEQKNPDYKVLVHHHEEEKPVFAEDKHALNVWMYEFDGAEADCKGQTQ